MMRSNSLDLRLTSLIGRAYYKIFYLLEKYPKLIHFWFKGGRGSLKSSFVALYVIYKMTQARLNGDIIHCVALRKVKDTIKDSVYSNLEWAIDMLNVGHLWDCKENPMVMKCGECTILFRGSANQKDFEKIKSIKFKKGFCRYAIFEELTEFKGVDETMSIIQSLFRGGKYGTAFYMYNPPASRNNWVNQECMIKRRDRIVFHSNYLDVPVSWLGDIFINEAETIKIINPRKYNSMYLGAVLGEGLEIYPEKEHDGTGLVTYRSITDDEIKSFTQVERGLDFGYSHATAYSETFHNPQLQKLYVFDEVYGHKMSNMMIYLKVYDKAEKRFIIGDSEDPRTINELRSMGLNIYGAKKGHDSKPHGIKWLQDRAEIIIDKKRCPNIAYDFQNYEYKKDKEGTIIYDYPKEPDGSASVRYSQERAILNQKWEGIK